MPIQIGGIVSGIDTEAVIQQLLDIDAKSKAKLETKKKEIEDKKGVVGELETKLKAIKTESDKMLLSSTFQKRAGSSTDTTVATVTVGDGATPGTYSILVDRLATQSTNKSTAGTNTNQSRRSSQSVTPGTSPLDLSKPFATAGFPSTLDISTTATFTTGADGAFTSAMLSTYSSVQSFIDAANASAANINVWYDATTDRFNFEKKNNPADTLSLTESAMNGLFTSTYVATGATAGNETGLNSSATLDKLNTDAAITMSGSLTINGVAIAYNVATDTLSGLISKINNQSASTGVNASYDQTLDRVVVTRTTEGPQSIIMTDTGNALAGLKLNGATTVGNTALFSVNGDTITSDSNSYSFSGINLSLKKQGNNDGMVTAADASTSINITQDTSSVATSVKAFVSAYNDFADFLKANANYDAATKTAGKLFGDSMVNSIESRLKRLLVQPQSALTSTHQLLSQLGIQSGAFQSADGHHLVVDDAKLTSALASNPTAAEALFGRSTTGAQKKNVGIAYDISAYVQELTKFQGLVDLKDASLDSQIKNIDDRMFREDERLSRIEASLRRQFTAMETSLSLINAQGSSLTQQLNRL